MSSNITMLGKYTSLGVGGPSMVAVLRSADEALSLVPEANFVLGYGTNVLISDEGLTGLTLINRMNEVRVSGEIIYAQSGVSLPVLSRLACKHALCGLEWACGIPGSVGGAIKGNAGAYGHEIKDFVLSVDLLRGGKKITLSVGEIGFSYRQSGLVRGDFVLGATLRLKRSSVDAVKKRMQAYKDKRLASQPSGKTAGSTFAAADIPAWEYVDGAGFRGAREGGAFVSEKHANFIINDGTATANDVYRLIRRIERGVAERYGVKLRREIRILGNFSD